MYDSERPVKGLEALLETKNLNFNGLIDYEDICIPAGKVTFLTGESGSGKSTLLKMFNGIITPQKGRILYKGQDITEMDAIALRRKVSLVSQEVYLFDGDIGDNFAQFYRYRDMACPSNKIIKEMMSLCGLNFPVNKDTAEMSGGERQRLYLAVFLSFQPETVLLDEPTSALDATTGRLVMKNILDFCRGNEMNAVVVSHAAELTQDFSENIVTLKRRVG